MTADDRADQLRNVAATRGEAWADSLARRIPLAMPWPSDRERVLVIARRKVADMTDDEQLREQLAIELAAWAERRWNAAREALG